MRRFVRRPSPAMIVALIALVAATAGNAIADQVTAAVSALKANSVTSTSVKNGSLLTKDFKKSELKKLTGKTGKTGATGAAGAAGAAGPQGPAGTPDGYTKTEADAAFLGKTAKSADADKLDGVDGSSFVTGGGSQNFGSQLLNSGDANKTLLTIPNIGVITTTCTNGSPETMQIIVTNDQSSIVRMSYAILPDASSATDNDVGGRQLAASGGNFNFNLGADNSQVTLQFTKTTGAGLFTTTNTASVLLTAITNPTSDADKCRFQAQVQTGSSGFSFVIFTPVLLP